MGSEVTRLMAGTPLARFTGAFGFVESTATELVKPFAELMSARPQAHAPGPLDEALARLLPSAGEPPQNRYLLAPTRSEWVAYFANAVRNDPRLAAAELPDRLNCRTLLVYAVAREPELVDSPLSMVGLSLRGPGKAGLLDAIRTLMVYDDEPEPQTYGDPLPFEDTEPQELGLSLDWLARYCRALGVQTFEPSFYLPPGTGGTVLDSRPDSIDSS